MLIEVFGPGCAKCKQTAQIMTLAVERSGVKADDVLVQKVEDLRIAAMRGVMSTPAVAIDGRIVSQGKVPTVEEAAGWVKGQA
jgi:small redox-active disulfide protein 2